MIGYGIRWQYPDLTGGFNRLDGTIIKAGGGQVIAKEGADGLLGLGIIHPDYPNGLGVVIKIAHGWNAGNVVCRSLYWCVLDIDLRNPYVAPSESLFWCRESFQINIWKNSKR